MAYTRVDYPTKKALKYAIASGVKVAVYQPNSDLTGIRVDPNGTVFLEGPHYPKPHTWYAQGEMRDGYLVKVR